MKPQKFSAAHHSPDLAELVCSNSLRSNEPSSAVGLLKEEMRRLGSLTMAAAAQTSVPAGRALAVDRTLFARRVTEAVEDHPLIEVVREEVAALPLQEAPTIVATGPLTSDGLSRALAELTGSEHLYFYDAIAPVVEADSINMSRVFRASRYGAGDDYLNCPLDEAQYQHFLRELLTGERVPLAPFEEGARYFEGCLPIEVMAERGPDTPRFGPMKPVGLVDPRTGKQPYAVVQLRQENRQATLYNLVGFQTKLRYGEQERVFRLIPGLEGARFARLGSIHRNTFVKGPEVLLPTLQLKARPDVFLAGQITGVEGYVESAAMGILAGINAARLLRGEPLVVPPLATAIGALTAHVSGESLTPSGKQGFQPMNVNFGLFEPLTGRVKRKDKGAAYAERALKALSEWMEREGLERAPEPPGP
jgi:methylenetetrahydrofolate--tRNA-(uracil-5-)-methyltransferase